jgi:hypothetical protein
VHREARRDPLLPAPRPLNGLQVKITASGLTYSRVSQTFDGRITMTNIGDEAINSPVHIRFELMPDNVTLANLTGDFLDDAYITVLNSGSLLPGQSVAAVMQFKNPSNKRIDFIPAGYSGEMK